MAMCAAEDRRGYVLTDHNRQDRESLDEIARGHKIVCELLEFCESALHEWSERQRKFLSAWGAVGQAHGKWGSDIGNVTYATAWHHLMQEADTRRWYTSRTVTARGPSGDMIEICFGCMYISDKKSQTLEAFVAHANYRRLHAYADVYESVFNLSKINAENWQRTSEYRFALETYVLGWRGLLFEARSEWRRIFCQYNINATWNPKEILMAFEVMRLGHPVKLLGMFKNHPLPPPSATIDAETWMKFWSPRNV